MTHRHRRPPSAAAAKMRASHAKYERTASRIAYSQYSSAFLHNFVRMRLLSILLLSPLFAAVIASIVIGTIPYQLRHSLRCTLPLRIPLSPLQQPNPPPPSPPPSLRCSLPPSAAELLLHAMHAFERAPPFAHHASVASAYELMCLPPTASVEQLKHSFREFALRHHPDKSPQSAAATMCGRFCCSVAARCSRSARAPGTQRRAQHSTASSAIVRAMTVSRCDPTL